MGGCETAEYQIIHRFTTGGNSFECSCIVNERRYLKADRDRFGTPDGWDLYALEQSRHYQCRFDHHHFYDRNLHDPFAADLSAAEVFTDDDHHDSRAPVNSEKIPGQA